LGGRLVPDPMTTTTHHERSTPLPTTPPSFARGAREQERGKGQRARSGEPTPARPGDASRTKVVLVLFLLARGPGGSHRLAASSRYTARKRAHCRGQCAACVTLTGARGCPNMAKQTARAARATKRGRRPTREYSREFTPRGVGRTFRITGVPPWLYHAVRAKLKREGKSFRALVLSFLRDWLDAQPVADRHDKAA
jgi:hypothetical protein